MMANTISVQLVNSQSDDPITDLNVPEGTTIQDFLDLNRVNTNNMIVTLRRNGHNVDYDSFDEELQDDTRVTVTPEKVKGA
jgi:hypothetical protein